MVAQDGKPAPDEGPDDSRDVRLLQQLLRPCELRLDQEVHICCLQTFVWSLQENWFGLSLPATDSILFSSLRLCTALRQVQQARAKQDAKRKDAKLKARTAEEQKVIDAPDKPEDGHPCMKMNVISKLP